MRITIVGPVAPFRGGIARHSMATAVELARREGVELSVVSFARQYPAFLYPGESDLDPSAATPVELEVDFRIDFLNPLSWRASARRIARAAAEKAGRVLVCLDSNHTASHVLDELEAYAPLTSPGSYCVVFDTVVEDLPAEMFADRPWGPGNSPKTAVHTYLDRLANEGLDGRPLALEIDRDIDRKLLISVTPDGFLRRRAAGG